MLFSGLPNVQSKSSGDLLALLANPKKSADVLKKLKAESTSVSKKTKDLLKAQSVTAYCKKKEAEAQQHIQDAVLSIKEVETEKKKAAKVDKTRKSKLDAKELELEEATLLLERVRLDLDKLNEELQERDSRLNKKQTKLDFKMVEALDIKSTYEDKLKDLKDRMRGL